MDEFIHYNLEPIVFGVFGLVKYSLHSKLQCFDWNLNINP
jgi:hypothetical protein